MFLNQTSWTHSPKKKEGHGIDSFISFRPQNQSHVQFQKKKHMYQEYRTQASRRAAASARAGRRGFDPPDPGPPPRAYTYSPGTGSCGRRKPPPLSVPPRRSPSASVPWICSGDGLVAWAGTTAVVSDSSFLPVNLVQ